MNLSLLRDINAKMREGREIMYATNGTTHYILDCDYEAYCCGTEEDAEKCLTGMTRWPDYTANLKRKIDSVSYTSIIFDDGTEITYTHEQDCCEHNYADFEQLDDLARGYTFKGKLLFESCEGGFRFGDSRRMFFVPCYSEQNGYYTYEVDILVNGRLVLATKGEGIYC